MIRLMALIIVAVLGGLSVVARRAPTTFAAETTSAPDTAAALYARHCSSCHGRNGTPPRRDKRARNFRDKEWQQRVSDERIFNVISNGKNKMPAFSKKLKEAEIDSLVSYVRTLGN